MFFNDVKYFNPNESGSELKSQCILTKIDKFAGEMPMRG